MLYIAGPMTGHHEFNYPAFRVAADALTRAGYTVAHTGSLAALSFLTATGTAPNPPMRTPTRTTSDTPSPCSSNATRSRSCPAGKPPAAPASRSTSRTPSA